MSDPASSPDAVRIAAAVAAVRARIAAACLRAGRAPDKVRLLPVTKTVSAERLRAARAAGVRTFGENKVQEAYGKWRDLADPSIDWSLIGHLQTNKAKVVARFAGEFQALDDLRVAEALERRLQIEGRGLDVFVQVNTSGESTKYGVAPEAAAALVKALRAYPSLRLRGFMTLAVFSGDQERVRACFQRLRLLRDDLRTRGLTEAGELSMGMSGDFECAIEEGSTMVRVGQAIFGPRAQPDSVYWPGA